jgi:hypothetical protein
MPWYSQLAGLPDTHKLWADPGSTLEGAYVRLGYVEVPAPGAEEPPEFATGGVLAPGTIVLVGETGPEPLVIPERSEVVASTPRRNRRAKKEDPDASPQ